MMIALPYVILLSFASLVVFLFAAGKVVDQIKDGQGGTEIGPVGASRSQEAAS